MENLRVEEPKPKPTNKGYRKEAKCFAWISASNPRSNFGQDGTSPATAELGGSVDGLQI